MNVRVAAITLLVAVAACAPPPGDDTRTTRRDRGDAEQVDDDVDDDDGDGADDGDVDDGDDDDVTVDPPTTPAPEGWSELESEMLVLVNAFRAAGGDCPSGPFSPVPPLQANDALWRAARAHSEDMAANDVFDHVGSDGSHFADRIYDEGYDGDPRAENIAAGSTDAAGTFSQWVNSDGHCRNMTSSAVNEIGVGFASGGTWGAYWTQTFGSR